jgi:predicted metal-dependent hydrolase
MSGSQKMERSEVHFGRTCVSYAVRRSARRATVAIAVEPTGEVVVTAPEAVAIERLDRLVQKKARWIVERLRRMSGAGAPLREFVSGETFYYLGRQHRLRVCEGEPGVRLVRGWLEVTLDEPKSERAKRVHAALVTWYRVQAERRLPDRVEYWAKRVGVEVPEVRVREQQKRWASCDTRGTLRFNWRVIQAAMTAIDYIVVHELVHLRHREHSAAYWRHVGRVMPDYEVRREQLRRWGRAAVW